MIQHLVFLPIMVLAALATTVVIIRLIIELKEHWRANPGYRKRKLRVAFRPVVIKGGRPDQLISELPEATIAVGHVKPNKISKSA